MIIATLVPRTRRGPRTRLRKRERAKKILNLATSCCLTSLRHVAWQPSRRVHTHFLFLSITIFRYTGQQFGFFLFLLSPSVSVNPLLSSTSVSSIFLSNLKNQQHKCNHFNFHLVCLICQETIFASAFNSVAL